MPKIGKVFLGGTCNDSTWRETFIPKLKTTYFNPIVPEWTYAAQLEEERQKKICKWHLYVITPKMKGVFSVAELIDDGNKNPQFTIGCFLKNDGDALFDDQQWNSILAVMQLARRNGVKCFTDLDEVLTFFNA